ncbi:MAG: hypothetical protein ACRCUS_09515 [Anaerovoracaceae bacterium]
MVKKIVVDKNLLIVILLSLIMLLGFFFSAGKVLAADGNQVKVTPSDNFIYLDRNGDNANDGLTPGNAKATLMDDESGEGARSALIKHPEYSIMQTSYFFFARRQELYLDLDPVRYPHAMIIRGGNFTQPMYIIMSDEENPVTFSNIVIDGGNKINTITNCPEIVQMTGGGKVVIDEGTVLQNNTNTSATGGGGAINSTSSCNVEMNGGIIRGNIAKSGGGIYSDNSTLTINGGLIENNLANDKSQPQFGGGGIFCKGLNGSSKEININNAEIRNNESKSNGGGILIDNYVKLSIKNTSITKNKSAGLANNIVGNYFGGGAGICSNLSEINIDSSAISENRSESPSASGGGIWMFQSKAIITGSTISKNFAVDNSITGQAAGGAIFSGMSKFDINNCKIIGNEANSQLNDGQSGGVTSATGGGICTWGMTYPVLGTANIIKNSELENNRAVANNLKSYSMGGAFANLGTLDRTATIEQNRSGELVLEDNLISGNSADFGGGLFLAVGAQPNGGQVTTIGKLLNGKGVFGNTAEYSGDDILTGRSLYDEDKYPNGDYKLQAADIKSLVEWTDIKGKQYGLFYDNQYDRYSDVNAKAFPEIKPSDTSVPCLLDGAGGYIYSEDGKHLYFGGASTINYFTGYKFVNNDRDITFKAVDMVDYLGGSSISGDEFPKVKIAKGSGDFFKDDTKDSIIVSDIGKGETIENYVSSLYKFYLQDSNGTDAEIPTEGKPADPQKIGSYTIKYKKVPKASRIGATFAVGDTVVIETENGKYFIDLNNGQLITRPTVNKKETEIVSYTGSVPKLTKPVTAPLARIETGAKIVDSMNDLVIDFSGLKLIQSDFLDKYKTTEQKNKLNASIDKRMKKELLSGYHLTKLRMELANGKNGNIYCKKNTGKAITVTLPYPKGTNKNFKFMILHYSEGEDLGNPFDYDTNNPKEYISGKGITNTEAGIQFEISDFSPFALAYPSKDNPGGDGYDEDGFDEDGYDKDGYDKDGYDKDGYDKDGYDKDGYDRDGNKKPEKDPETGDNYDLGLWTALMSIALLSVSLTYTDRKRRKQKQ